MLRGKYIKYSPEITFEVFQKIWDKLIEDGWVEYYFRSCEECYKEFISKGCITHKGLKCPKQFSFYQECVLSQDDLEMDITQFLSRKLTEFPIEGCCKTNDPLLIKFLDKKYPLSNPNPPKHFSGVGWSNTGFWYLINTEKSSKPLYSLEELKPLINISDEKYVKVINDGKSYKNHPEYKEFGCNSNTEYTLTNRIYKVIRINDYKGIVIYALDYNGDHYLISEDGIEASTKEEYDKQFSKTKVTSTISTFNDLKSSWMRDQEDATLKGQRIHELFYKECGIFPDLKNYNIGYDRYDQTYIESEETFPQLIFLKEDEIVKVKQINQIKELKFLNIK